jgi:predicted ABC-type ATPase
MNHYPQLYVIAGPNGAGKTTFARQFLPQTVKVVEFVNADLIAAGISPLAPEAGAIAAGRLMRERIHTLARQRKDFGFETTLSGRSYLQLFRHLKRCGYEIHVAFVWLQSVELALKRVADRVRLGGHNVPAAVVRRRYAKGLHNLTSDYRAIWKSVSFYDNSGASPVLVYAKTGGILRVLNEALYREVKRLT